MASRNWQRKLCLSSSVKGRVSVFTGLRLGLKVERGPLSLTSAAGAFPLMPLTSFACSPTVPVFHS